MSTHPEPPATLPEYRHLFRLGVPIIGAQLAQMGMGVVDTIMAGRVSAVDLAGVALGGSVLWPVVMLLMGVLQAVPPTVSQLHGADRVAEVGRVVRQALWLAVASALLAIVVITNAAAYYAFMAVDPAAAILAVEYLRMTAFGLPALMAYAVFRYLCEGMGHTRPPAVIAILVLLLKIPLNQLFIAGGLGIAPMGGAGCGLASAVVMWVELLLVLGVVWQPRLRRTGWNASFDWPNADQLARLIRVGGPIGVTIFLEVGVFSLTTTLVGRMGAEVVAAHAIASNLNGITFMLPLALGMAATIRVGYNVGADDWQRARHTAFAALACSLALAIVLALIILLFRTQIAALYATDPTVVELAASLMVFIAVYQLFDDAQGTAIGVLRGYKDTRAPMWIALVSYWMLGLPVGYGLAFGVFGRPLGIYGFWIGLSVGLAAVALSVCLRVWRTSRDPVRIRTLSGLR